MDCFSTPAPKAGARATLFCFPHAGGSAAVFTPWSRALADKPIEIIAAQLPGRDGADDPPSADLASIIHPLAETIGAHLRRPYALFGHSLGALVAFELARALRDHGAPLPACLFVSGAFPPQLPATATPLRFIDDDVAFLEAVAARYGGVPRIVLEQAELRTAMVPALRADLALTETYVYRPGAPLACPIVAYAGDSDPVVSGEQLEHWREQTSGTFACRIFDGHHFYLNRARDALLADLTVRLLRLV